MNVSAFILSYEHRGAVITLVIHQGKDLGLIIKSPWDSSTYLR